MMSFLALPQQHATRQHLAAECWRAWTAQSLYRDSHEKLTPLRADPPSLMQLSTAQLVEKAQSTDVDKVRAAFKSNIEFDAPGGKIKLDPKTQHIYKRFYMGRIRDDKQFDIAHKTDLIPPVPYPEIAFPGKSCDHTAEKS